MASIKVDATPQQAFRQFTDDIGHWWQANRLFLFSHNGMGKLQFEPNLNGRLTENFADGSEFEVGRILTWQPGVHLGFNWHQETYAEDPVTQVDIRFDVVGKQTRIVVMHKGWHSASGSAQKYGQICDTSNGRIFLPDFSQWWQDLLQSYAQSVQTGD